MAITVEQIRAKVEEVGMEFVEESYVFRGRPMRHHSVVGAEFREWQNIGITPNEFGNTVCFFGCPKGFLGNSQERWPITGMKKVSLDRIPTVLNLLKVKA
jgi:hypothetical protein